MTDLDTAFSWSHSSRHTELTLVEFGAKITLSLDL
jgi:hypothetical protein